MKLLLVLGSDDNYGAFIQTIEPLGYDLIRYRHVLKAMDNIDEIDPAAIVISARDFPRHWKILVQFVRNERSKEVCPIIILKGDRFNAEETSKAFFLGVNGVITETLQRQEEVHHLKTILDRSAPPSQEQKPWFFVEPWHRIGLLIADIAGNAIITGNVITISTEGLSFSPDHPLPIQAVMLNKELKECSLRIGDAILSPVCRITGIEKNIPLEFVSFPNDEQRILERYLKESFSK
jgi:hypothetical protein